MFKVSDLATHGSDENPSLHANCNGKKGDRRCCCYYPSGLWGGDDDCKRAIKGVLWTPGYKCLHNLNRISVILTAGDGASFVQSVQGEFPGGRPEKSVPLRISPPPSFKADKCSYSSDKSLRIISIWIPGN